MSTLYDNEPKPEVLVVDSSLEEKKHNEIDENAEIAYYQERSANALKLVDDIVLKHYLTKLSDMNIIPMSEDMLKRDELILFKVNKMMYEKDEYATDKFVSVVSAMTYTNSSIFLIVDGHKDRTDFYLGIKCNDEKREKNSIAETFKNALIGQFPGIKLDDGVSYIKKDATCSEQDKLLDKFKKATRISSCVGIPSYKNSKGEYTNANFIQGIEKFASAMQGKEYTAVILASNLPYEEISAIREGYETVYTELSSMTTRQLAYSTNESLANAISRTKGYSDTHMESTAQGVSDATAHTESGTRMVSDSSAHAEGETEENGWGKASKGVMGVGGTATGIGGTIAGVGMALTATGAGATVGIPMMAVGSVVAGAGAVVSGVGSLLGMGAKTKSKSDTETHTESTSHTTSDGVTHTTSVTTTVSDSHTDSFSETNGETSTIGSSKNFTITIQNKHLQEILKRIDKQLARIEMCESTGLWSTGAYFLSYNVDHSIAETGATIFRSIMQGEQSGVEMSAINTWNSNKVGYKDLTNYIGTLTHPLFSYINPIIGANMTLYPTSLISSKELAILMGLPRKSVPGLPVVEHVSFAKEVIELNKPLLESRIKLGCISEQGEAREDNKVLLDINKLAQHTFITGSTGSGKSNALYLILSQLKEKGRKFMVIEPAKGEYKHVFGNCSDVYVYGTNPKETPLLKINPFAFPDNVYIYEHIDRMVEIFNACWPMYAAMPAVLKMSIENAYISCGWDMINSHSETGEYPTFDDVLFELRKYINSSEYSTDSKSDYKGALETRLQSLSSGIMKYIFTSEAIPDNLLFNENVIIDLSCTAEENKALLMGLLVLKLKEIRRSGINSELKHVTVLEEAHNLLKKTLTMQSQESANLIGKSVEMIANSIAEMRTYGEGFIIADQSPSMLDAAAIRNTNTKIVLTLPDKEDREIAGKSMGLKEQQVEEISKLKTGNAIVYQNQWEEAVLCHIDKAEIDVELYRYVPEPLISVDEKLLLLLIDCYNSDKIVPQYVVYDLLKASKWHNLLKTDLYELSSERIEDAEELDILDVQIDKEYAAEILCHIIGLDILNDLKKRGLDKTQGEYENNLRKYLPIYARPIYKYLDGDTNKLFEIYKCGLNQITTFFD